MTKLQVDEVLKQDWMNIRQNHPKKTRMEN